MADPNTQQAQQQPDEYSTPIPQGASAGSPASSGQDEYSTPIPQGAQAGAPPATQQPDQPGLLSRMYETSGLKSMVDLGSQMRQRPIDMYHEAVEAAHNGDWKTASEVASKMVFGGPGNVLDSKNPLYKAAEQLIMQPVNEVKANYDAKRKAGQGAMTAAGGTAADILDPATRVENAVHRVAPRVKADVKSGNYAGVVGDVIGSGTSGTDTGAVPLVGGAVQQVTGNLDEDLHAHNYRAALGDVLGPAATAGLGKILGALGEAGESEEGTAGAGSGNRFTRAAETVNEMNEVAKGAPTTEEAQAALRQQVETAKAADHATVNDTAEQAHRAVEEKAAQAQAAAQQTAEGAVKNVNAAHQTATAEGLAEQAQSELAQHEGEQALHEEAAQAPGDEAITTAAENAANQSNQAMHDKYADSEEKMQELTEGTEPEYVDSSLHKAAKSLTGADETAGPLTQAVAKSLPGSPGANAILENLLKLGEPAEEGEEGANSAASKLTPEEYQSQLEAHGIDPDSVDEGKDLTQDAPSAKITMPDLMRTYKILGEKSRSTGFLTDTARADQGIYSTLKKGIIDTIGHIANESGNPEAIELSEQMNKDYRENVRLYENPAVKALRGGKLADVDKYLTGGQGSLGNINTMKQVLGSHWEDFARSSMQRMVADYVQSDGSINYKGLINKLSSPGMKPEIRNAMYGQNADTILSTLNKVKTAGQQAGAASEAISAADQAKADAMSGIGKTAAGKSAQIADELAQSKEGIGKTAAGKTQQINDSIAHIVGDGDIADIVKDPERRAQLQEAVGTDGMKKLGDIWMRNQIAKASNYLDKDGNFVKTRFNPDPVLKAVNEFKDSPEAMDALFKPDAEAATRYNELIGKMQNVASVKKLIKYGVISPALAAGGAAFGPWSGAIAYLLGPGQELAASFSKTRSVLDTLASHPYMWKAVGAVGKAADAVPVKAAIKGAASVGKAATDAADTSVGRGARAAVYSAVQGNLGGSQQQPPKTDGGGGATSASSAPNEPIVKYENPEDEPSAISYARNKEWSKPGPYITKLTTKDETEFQRWAKANPKLVENELNTKTPDYDVRGRWLADKKGDPEAKLTRSEFDGTLHASDKWKTPYDAVFSRESQYALSNAPRWDADKLVTHDGRLVVDETPKKKGSK